MKCPRVTFVLLPLLLLSASTSANSPAPMPLEQMVKNSDYIFVGVVTAVNYVDLYGRVTTPEQIHRRLHERTIEIRVRVTQVLYPQNLRPSGIAKLRIPIPGGRVDPKTDTVRDQRETLAYWRRMTRTGGVFLTRVVSPENQEAYVVTAGDNAPIKVGLKAKPKILSLIQQKLGPGGS